MSHTKAFANLKDLGFNGTKFLYYEVKCPIKDRGFLKTGKNHTIEHIADSTTVAIPFNAGGGDFTVEVCFDD